MKLTNVRVIFVVMNRTISMNTDILLRAYQLMCTSQEMAAIYEENRNICHYVHSTSRGHEAIQLATAFQLLPCDYVSPYYRDESLLLGIGFTPYQLMLQLLAKKDDPFSGGRTYYAHPSAKDADKPKIIHQSSATGMQAIPTTGIAQGIQYLDQIGDENYSKGPNGEKPIVICSLGDASVTEGEISEAFQVAALKKLPIIFLVQDNQWGISVTAKEARAMDAYEYAAGFPGIERIQFDGSDFSLAYEKMNEIVQWVRTHQTPFIVQANVSLLGHHTSGVRKEFYRDAQDWLKHAEKDPIPLLRNQLLANGLEENQLLAIETTAKELARRDFESAKDAPEPSLDSIYDHIFADTDITEEIGNRDGYRPEKIPMVDAALFAIQEILADHPTAILFGQDVGRRLGGVFREAATLAEKFGDHRVFNTAIQEAYIIGSTVGLSAVGVKPIVEVQFGDYIYPGFNQLVTEVAKSNYLTNGKYPVQAVYRIPVGAYGGGGPYHSSSIESILMGVKGIKVVYPSNAADMKGLMKAAFYDPNPVVVLEHKGLYWSKIPGTENAKRREPAKDYIIPIGKANIVQTATDEYDSIAIITYGMGVHWATEAAKSFEGHVEIVDLRSLYPFDEQCIEEQLKKHGKAIFLTEEQLHHSYMETLAGKFSSKCFQYLDAPIQIIGAKNIPAVPLNKHLEKHMLPSVEKIKESIQALLSF